METKSIGGFIAALRKANGMTQKDLAEKLAVSDKTVSRWERGDGLPDLSVVPVIAEIFNVSCDELLCGERKKVSDEPVDNEQSKSRRQKQLRRVLDGGLQKFKNQSYISRAILLVGVLAAMIGNFGFYEALIGYFVAVAIMVVAVVVQVVSANNAYYAVSGDEFDAEDLQKYKVKIYELNRSFVFCLVVAFSVISPLVMAVGGAGMSEELFVASAFVLLVVWLGYFLFGQTFLARHAVANGVYTEGKVANVFKLQKLKNKTVILALVLGAFCFGTMLLYHSFYSANSFAEKTMFAADELQEFKEYMEQDIKHFDSYYANDDVIVEEYAGKTQCYDIKGNEISKEEALTRTIEDDEGNVLLTYVKRNESVCNVSVSWTNGELKYITATTYEAFERGQAEYLRYSNMFNLSYPLVFVICSLYYVANRKKYLA